MVLLVVPKLDVIEVQTVDGWIAVMAKVWPIGRGRYQAEVPLPVPADLTDAPLRYHGRPIRHIIKETRASSRPRVVLMVIEFTVVL